MLDRQVDLHSHTYFSDGTLSPEKLVQRARQVRLSALAITDHDITDGIEPAMAEGNKCGVEIVPGIELSSQFEAKDQDAKNSEIHILGYFLDWKNAELQRILRQFRSDRENRARDTITKLSAIGLPMDFKDIQETTKGASIGRPHIARAMMNAGYVSSYDEAFTHYLTEGRPGFVPKPYFSTGEAIDLIHRTGGVASIAHPIFGGPRNSKGWKRLVDQGLDAIEAYHSQHSAATARNYAGIAQEYGLLITGGSDYHTDGHGPRAKLGRRRIAYTYLEKLKEKAKIK